MNVAFALLWKDLVTELRSRDRIVAMVVGLGWACTVQRRLGVARVDGREGTNPW